MRVSAFVMSACLCVSSASVSCAGTRAPDDVVRFVRNADQCEHLAGEWDSTLSTAEKRQIERSVIKYCGAAQKQLETLKIKYKDDVAVKKVLADHQYESVTSFVK